MVVAVWGASGFVGRHVVDVLTERGDCVVALCRDRSVLPASWGEGVEVRRLPPQASKEDFRSALAGVSELIHCAGSPTAGPGELAAYEEGVRMLAVAAGAAGVRRLVVVSTVGVYGSAATLGPPVGIETRPRPYSTYAKSRLRAEEAVRDAIDADLISLTIVRISAVVGAAMTATVLRRFFAGLRWGVFVHPGPATATFPCIGVRRLARSLVELAQRQAGEAPTLCQFSDDVEWTAMARWYGEITGRTVTRVPLPGAPVRAVAQMLGLCSLVVPLQLLGNTIRYADDGKHLAMDAKDMQSSTSDDIVALLNAEFCRQEKMP